MYIRLCALACLLVLENNRVGEATFLLWFGCGLLTGVQTMIQEIQWSFLRCQHSSVGIYSRFLIQGLAFTRVNKIQCQSLIPIKKKKSSIVQVKIFVHILVIWLVWSKSLKMGGTTTFNIYFSFLISSVICLVWSRSLKMGGTTTFNIYFSFLISQKTDISDVD